MCLFVPVNLRINGYTDWDGIFPDVYFDRCNFFKKRIKNMALSKQNKSTLVVKMRAMSLTTFTKNTH